MSAKASILIVDDSQNSPAHIARLLEQKGYTATVVPSGEEALALFQTVEINLVITELILPGLSGLNLLKQVKEMKPDVDVVIITSNASGFTAIKALRFGAYDYIVKPLDDEVLLYKIVEQSLERQQLFRENRRLVENLAGKNAALEDALTMMKTLNKSCALISSSLEIGEILKMLVESAVEQLNVHKGYLLLLDRTGEFFSMKVSVGIDRQLAKNFHMQKDRGISGCVAAENQPLLLQADFADRYAQKMVEEDAAGELFSSPGLLAVPLRVKERVVGVVNISGRKSGRSFADQDVEFLATLANHAAIALDHAGSFYKLRTGKR